MPIDSPTLAFAVLMLAGVLGQAISRHVAVPGIVVLLATGVLLGPDGANILDPAAFGPAKEAIVGFAVAIILFEGGMRLDIGQLRKQKLVIRRLVLAGAVVTTLGGALAARGVLGWDWRTSILFGTLVMVTGPTVVGPLVRRIRLAPSIAVVLEAEGVFIDAVGAAIAVVALELAVHSAADPVGAATSGVATRLVAGASIGACGGLALAMLLRIGRLVPRGMENILALSAAVAIYQTSQALVPESGIGASVAAGLVVGNLRIRRMGQLVEFKEQLTTLLIGILFILLAADVRMSEVGAIGTRALVVVAILALVVRPITVSLATAGSGMKWREKLFISWIGPRGIVAAAVASVFANQLAHLGIPGGAELRALVFVVIATTVTIQGLTAGPLASLLGLRRASRAGYVILGANAIARYIALRLQRAGQPVELIDTDSDDTRRAEEAGLKVIFGNGLDPRVLAKARVDTRSHIVALTQSESVNMLFVQRVNEVADEAHASAAIDADMTGIDTKMAHELGARVAFAGGENLDDWLVRWRHHHVEVVRRMYVGPPSRLAPRSPGVVLPLVVEHRDSVAVIDDRTIVRDGDVVELAIANDAREVADRWFAEGAWLEVAGAAHHARPTTHPPADTGRHERVTEVRAAS